MTVNDIIQMIEAHAPLKLACAWDNPGLLTGRRNAEVTTVLTALDIDIETAHEAKDAGAEMIITHHPLIFDPIKQVNEDTYEGRVLMFLIENKIALYSAHTNLDAAPNGTNDYLAKLYGLYDTECFEITYEDENGTKYGLGRVGKLKEPTTLKNFAYQIAEKLGLSNINYVGDDNIEIKTAAICSGGGGSLISHDIADIADVYITGDVKYSNARNAFNMNLPVIIADHYSTEIFSHDIFADMIHGVRVVKSKRGVNVVKGLSLNG